MYFCCAWNYLLIVGICSKRSVVDLPHLLDLRPPVHRTVVRFCLLREKHELPIVIFVRNNDGVFCRLKDDWLKGSDSSRGSKRHEKGKGVFARDPLVGWNKSKVILRTISQSILKINHILSWLSTKLYCFAYHYPLSLGLEQPFQGRCHPETSPIFAAQSSWSAPPDLWLRVIWRNGRLHNCESRNLSSGERQSLAEVRPRWTETSRRRRARRSGSRSTGCCRRPCQRRRPCECRGRSREKAPLNEIEKIIWIIQNKQT